MFWSGLKRHAIITIICCATSHLAYADLATIRGANNTVWASAGGSFFNYKEQIPPPNLTDSERSTLPSLAGGASLMGRGYQYLSAETSLEYSNADYNGAFLFFPTVPVQSTTRELISSSNIRIGQGYPLGSSILITPYAELGFRYWNRDLGGGQKEDYQNFEGSGGLMAQVSPVKRLTLSVYGSAGTIFAGRVQADDDRFDLGNAGLFKFGGKLGVAVTPKVEIFTSVDYDYFRYIQSDVSPSGFYEPTSHTEDTAIRVGAAYHFDIN